MQPNENKNESTNEKRMDFLWRKQFLHILMCHICRLVACIPFSIYFDSIQKGGKEKFRSFFSYFVGNMNFRFYDNSKSQLFCLSMDYMVVDMLVRCANVHIFAVVPNDVSLA